MYEFDCRFDMRLNYINFLKDIEYLCSNYKNKINNYRLKIDQKIDFFKKMFFSDMTSQNIKTKINIY
jgi:hypothetical protein